MRPLSVARFALALPLLFAGPTLAQSGPVEGATEVRVASRVVPPFADRDASGAWGGLAVELWQQVARELGLESTFAEVELAEMLAGVAEGRHDVAVGALTVTAEREQKLDFCHPFLSSGIGIAVQAEGSVGAWTLIRQVASPAFLRVIAALTGLLFVCGLLVWVFERRANAEQFGGGLRGVGAGFWWSAVTMTTVGYGDKSPRTTGGRAVALVWMFTSIIVISGFTAAIASSLTLTQLTGAIQGPDDLQGARVGTVADSTSDRWTERRFVRATRFDDASSALEALARGDLDAVVYDAPVLRYLVKTVHGGVLTVLPGSVERQEYAFALPPGSQLREPINQALLEITSGDDWARTLEDYLGD